MNQAEPHREAGPDAGVTCVAGLQRPFVFERPVPGAGDQVHDTCGQDRDWNEHLDERIADPRLRNTRNSDPVDRRIPLSVADYRRAFEVRQP